VEKGKKTKQEGKVGGCTVKQPRTILRRQKEHRGSEITVHRTGATGNMKNTTVTVYREHAERRWNTKGKNKKGTRIQGSNISEADDMGNKNRDQCLTEK
jgi:hypothetical protein